MVDFAAHTARMIHRLGQPVTLTPVGGPARVVNAVFSRDTQMALGVVGAALQLRLTAVDGAGLAAGDGVTVGSSEYRITCLEDESDDAGDVLARLEVAS